MSDFEIATLFYQINQSAQSALANYIAVIFALLAAGYFAAHKLDKFSSSLLLLLFSVFCLGMANEVFGLYNDMGHLAGIMAEAGMDPSSSLGWHGAVRGGGDFLKFVVPKVIGFICLLSYISTIVFFLIRRKSNSSKQPSS